jgi:hypothetical protein
MVDCDFEIMGPPEVIAGARAMGERLRRAGAAGG